MTNFVKKLIISMSWVRDKEINLNPCQNSNSWPPKHWVYTLSTELGRDSQPFRRFIMNQVYMFESLLSSVDRAHTQCSGGHLLGRQVIFFVPHSWHANECERCGTFHIHLPRLKLTISILYFLTHFLFSLCEHNREFNRLKIFNKSNFV